MATQVSATLTHGPYDISGLNILFNFVTKYFWLPTIALGIPGNILCILVSLREGNRKISTCIYIAALAAVDTISLSDTVISFIPQFWTGTDITELQVR
jgi:hypothetical protein